MRKSFFLNWEGRMLSATIQNRWKPAEGSSLKPNEWDILNEGGVIRHEKDSSCEKLFAKDEEDQLWSVIVNIGNELDSLLQGLRRAGFAAA